jgi:hypothetical protein
MKLSHCSAFFLMALAWYLMRPPLPHLDTSAFRSDPTKSLARWAVVKSFPSQQECEAEPRGNHWQLCVASNDPRIGR